MSMLNALDMSSSGGMDLGAMSAAFGNSRENQAARQAEAIRQGRLANGNGADEVSTKARGVAEDFVSVFMNQVMKSMRATVQENPKMHGDNGEKFFQEMLDAEQSKTLAKGSGYGLTDLVYQALMANVQVTPVAESQAGMNSLADPSTNLPGDTETEDEKIAVDAIE